MEPEGSLPHLQEPAPRPYPKPDPPSPCLSTQLLEDLFRCFPSILSHKIVTSSGILDAPKLRLKDDVICI